MTVTADAPLLTTGRTNRHMSAPITTGATCRAGTGRFTVPLWQGVSVMRKHFLTYLALSTLAIAQPLFDLYGRNLTVFSAAKVSSAEVAVFVLLVLLGPAVAAVALLAVYARAIGRPHVP